MAVATLWKQETSMHPTSVAYDHSTVLLQMRLTSFFPFRISSWVFLHLFTWTGQS